ncbi:hypothetical protein [Streptomyces sp. CA-106110]|uniref:hypothetical protein n=1 Tax=Streptomyces sp. CA-106110 TaxID=3240044 RepID=UPI003D8B599C
MRRACAHDAAVRMAADGDVRTLGAAITVALCGHWDHEPPCPLAPHHTSAERSGDEVTLRVLFAAEPESEADVRSRIETALSRAVFEGPDGVTTRWEFCGAQPSAVRRDELEHAERLMRTA